MGRISVKAGGQSIVKKDSNKVLWFFIALNTITNITILLKIYGVL